MSKAILLSIKPKWVARILNGEKTIEVRKTMPKCDLPIDVYIYCSKENKNGFCMVGINGNETYYEKYDKDSVYSPSHNYIGNGKVVAKFTLNNIDRYINGHNCYYLNHDASSCIDYELILDSACLTDDELFNYVDDYSFYAWHIEDLVIFDEPKKLSEFKRPNPSKNKHLDRYLPVKIPQSYCYVESEDQNEKEN